MKKVAIIGAGVIMGAQGRYSYTYTKNIVGDNGAKNLIYVPASQDELHFKDYDYKDVNGVMQTYTAAEQAQDFWNYVENSKYLKSRKGMYAERNGLIGPWVNQIDFRVFQNFYIPIKNGQKNTIQVALDIRNVGNLFNKNWGHYYSVTQTGILEKVSGYKAGSDNAPVFKFQRNGTEVLKDEFKSSIGLGSTWMMQLSLRYIFR